MPRETQESGASTLSEWAEWKPAHPVEAPVFSDEQRRDIRLAWLESSRPEFLTADTPIPELIEWDDTEGKRAVECVQRMGFEAESAGPAGDIVVSNLTDSQRQRWQEVYWECLAQYTPPAERLGEWTQAQYEVMFEYFTTFYMPCMSSHGARYIGPAQPTRPVWLSQAQQGDAELWVPTDLRMWDMSGAEDFSSDEAIGSDVANHICPIKPPSAAIFGK